MKLSSAQRRVLEACDGRGILGTRCKRGILPVWQDTRRTVLVLTRLGLVRPTKVPEYEYNGITLTRSGAEMLVPPGKVTY
jgi:hypothetical protein